MEQQLKPPSSLSRMSPNSFEIDSWFDEFASKKAFVDMSTLRSSINILSCFASRGNISSGKSRESFTRPLL